MAVEMVEMLAAVKVSQMDGLSVVVMVERSAVKSDDSLAFSVVAK